MIAVLREHHSDVGKFFTKTEGASKHGLEAMAAVFKAQSMVQGLSIEQENALTKHMKEKQGDGGGKWKGKRQMPYLVPLPTTMPAAQAAPILQPVGQVWGYGGGATAQEWQIPAAGWTPGQSRQIQQQYIQAGGAGRGGGKAANMQRYPCVNCQQYGYWKYMPECPNFHLYLASHQAVLDAFRSGAGGSTATGADLVAVIPYTGTGTYRLIAR